MAKRNKDGSIEWTEAEELEIEMGAEARRRALGRDRADRAREAQAEKCEAGEHKTPVEGKCPACGAAAKAKPAEESPSKRIRIV